MRHTSDGIGVDHLALGILRREDGLVLVQQQVDGAFEWQGKPYEDKGEILELEPGKLLKSTHYSLLSGAEDTPANYHTLTYTLSEQNGQPTVTLTQDNNASHEEVEHATQLWEKVLQGMKELVEREWR